MVGSISISGVSKHFVNPTGERITALDNVSLDIPAGSFVSLIKPSGCGKSTLLRLISGLIPMDDGSLTLDSTPIKALVQTAASCFRSTRCSRGCRFTITSRSACAPAASTSRKSQPRRRIYRDGRPQGLRAFVSAPAFRRHVPARVSQEHSLASPRCSCSMSRSVHSMPSPA